MTKVAEVIADVRRCGKNCYGCSKLAHLSCPVVARVLCEDAYNKTRMIMKLASIVAKHVSPDLGSE